MKILDHYYDTFINVKESEISYFCIQTLPIMQLDHQEFKLET